jgi:nicotinamidase-related amidase
MSNGATKTALLIQDIQPLVVPAFGGDDALLARLGQVIAAARSKSIPVIYPRVAFRVGYADVSPHNQLFSGVTGMMDFTVANPATEIHPAVAPQDGDIQVLKRRVSSFSGSDLQLVLRSLGVERIVLAGVMTSGVVLSTVREAADLDYEIVVLSDGCADADPEVHNVLMTKVFPMQTTVSTCSEWISTL